MCFSNGVAGDVSEDEGCQESNTYFGINADLQFFERPRVADLDLFLIAKDCEYLEMVVDRHQDPEILPT
jgi:hypothetical protein